MNRTLPSWLVAVLAPAVFGGWAAPAPGEEWTYIAESGDGFPSPVPQAIRLARDLPEEMTQNVAYRGASQEYAQIRYGSDNSTRVIIVVDEVSRSEFDLYVDRNRNRVIEESDLVAGAGRLRTAPLNVEVLRDDGLDHIPRVVTFRRSITGGTLGFATAGFVAGRARLGARRVEVRRVDGDGNGFFADALDRIWIDLDEDGRWDPIAEQFPYMPVLRLNGRRFAVRADQSGGRLAFDEIQGVGRIRLEPASLADGADIANLDVMLIGEDGSAYSIAGGEVVVVPVGRYAMGSVSLAVLDGKSPDPWNFVFSRSGGEAPRRWYDVPKEGEVAIDPVGRLRFELQANGQCRAGEYVSVAPRLFTGDGLLINSSSCGQLRRFASHEKYNGALIHLESSEGKILGAAQSGFS